MRTSQVQLSASIAGTPVKTLVVTLSAPDISPPLVFNVQAIDGVAAGTIAIPTGTGRRLLVRAFDASGSVTHEGSTTIDVREGVNPLVSIALVPLVGSTTIDVRLGTLLVIVRPGEALIGPGQSLALSVVVTDVDGNPVAANANAISWGSIDSRIAAVNGQGMVTGSQVGSVQIIASYAGAAGATTISVAPAILSAGDIADCGKPNDEQTAAILDTIAGAVLPLGDNVYEDGTLAEYNACYGPSWGRHKARTHPVPGNHDYHVTNAAGYFDYFGALAGDRSIGYYSYDLGKWHLIALNSEISVSASSAQVTWLKADLAATNAKCVLAYWHKPRFSDGDSHGNNSSMGPMWDALYAAKAEIVLGGHDHNYERFVPQTPGGVAAPASGIRQFVVGTGGAPLNGFISSIQPTSEFRTEEFGVLRLVLGDTSYSWSFIAAPSGAVRDSGTTSCH